MVKKKQPSLTVPDGIEDRIAWNVQNKQSKGQHLCVKCQKVWDNYQTCRLCQLTV